MWNWSSAVSDSILILAIVAAVIAYHYFKQKTTQRRLELIHQERLAAMDKGIPLPELPIDPPRAPDPDHGNVALMLGIILTTFSVGTMIVLYMNLSEGQHNFWVTPLPVAMMGGGLMLYHFLSRERER
jgi:peptidoglycan/LPS O-acetylase OafA/YrhL